MKMKQTLARSLWRKLNAATRIVFIYRFSYVFFLQLTPGIYYGHHHSYVPRQNIRESLNCYINDDNRPLDLEGSNHKWKIVFKHYFCLCPSFTGLQYVPRQNIRRYIRHLFSYKYLLRLIKLSFQAKFSVWWIYTRSLRVKK